MFKSTLHLQSAFDKRSEGDFFFFLFNRSNRNQRLLHDIRVFPRAAVTWTITSVFFHQSFNLLPCNLSTDLKPIDATISWEMCLMLWRHSTLVYVQPFSETCGAELLSPSSSCESNDKPLTCLWSHSLRHTVIVAVAFTLSLLCQCGCYQRSRFKMNRWKTP